MKLQVDLSWKRLNRAIRTYALWHLGTIIGVFILLLVVVLINLDDASRVWSIWTQAMRVSLLQAEFYLLTVVPYLAFLLLRSLVRNFKRNRWAGLFRGIGLKVALPVLLVFVYTWLIDLYREGEVFNYIWDYTVENPADSIRNAYAIDQKQRGMHIFNLQSGTTALSQLNSNNFEWITLVPYINQEVYNKPPATDANVDNTFLSRRLTRLREQKRLADAHGFYVVLKPHIWLSTSPGGTWRSDIAMDSETDWEAWFAFYESTLLSYATLAEELDVDLFCIGTELHSTVAAHPERWVRLIAKVREVYSGQLTYAANWSDPLEDIPFWDTLDYIGIQAYFPIAENKSPDLEELEAGWQQHTKRLEALSQQVGKPVLFTEIGYKSTTDAGVAPWTWVQATDRFYRRISLRTQALCYEAFFNVVWPQPWMAGIHVWQWQAGEVSDGKNNGFSVEGKPALNVIARGFVAPN